MTSDAAVFIGMVYPCGLIRHMAYLACEINKRVGFDFYFASIKAEPDKNTWPLVRAGFAPDKILATDTFPELVAEIESLLSRYNRVLVHSGGGWGQTRLIAPLKKKYGKRLIHVVTTHSYHHGDRKRIPTSIILNWLYRKYADKVVFQCNFAAKRFVGGLKLLRDGKGTIIPLGVENFPDPNDIVPESLKSKTELTQVLLDNSLVKFIYLARICPEKKHLWLTESIAPSLKRYPNTRLLLCGTGSQKILDSVRNVVRKYGIENQVYLPGRISRDVIPWVLQHASCAIVASSSETFGHCYVEPMMAGLPVIGTRIGIGESVVQDYSTGMSISFENSDSMRRAVEFLVEHPSQAREMGQVAQKIAKDMFTHESVAASLSRLYEQLLSCSN